MKKVFLSVIAMCLVLVGSVWAEETVQEDYGMLRIGVSGVGGLNAGVGDVNSYLTSQLQKVMDTTKTIAGSNFVPNPAFSHPAQNISLQGGGGFNLSAFYLLDKNLSIGIKGGNYSATDFYVYTEINEKDTGHGTVIDEKYQYDVTSTLAPLMIGIDYSNNARSGFFYGGQLCAGVGIHSGNLKFTESFNDPRVSQSTTVWDRPFSSAGFVAEASGKFGYNIFKYLGIYLEAGYFYAPITTELTDVLSVTPTEVRAGSSDTTQNLKFDFSSILYKFGIMINL